MVCVDSSGQIDSSWLHTAKTQNQYKAGRGFYFGVIFKRFIAGNESRFDWRRKIFADCVHSIARLLSLWIVKVFVFCASPGQWVAKFSFYKIVQLNKPYSREPAIHSNIDGSEMCVVELHAVILLSWCYSESSIARYCTHCKFIMFAWISEKLVWSSVVYFVDSCVSRTADNVWFCVIRHTNDCWETSYGQRWFYKVSSMIYCCFRKEVLCLICCTAY